MEMHTMSKSSITTETGPDELLPLIPPGEILLEEFLKPLGLSQYRLARDLSVPPRRINEIVHGARAISADTALRLGRYFDMNPQFWLNLQSGYDLRREARRLGSRLEEEVSPLVRAG
ncbi:MAG TPA: HigA family addiction module antitoxin [Tepidiformaceae bacterium]|nr:HigA family addiction module antitoxin [Tepidiformaceae bacterium]